MYITFGDYCFIVDYVEGFMTYILKMVHVFNLKVLNCWPISLLGYSMDVKQ